MSSSTKGGNKGIDLFEEVFVPVPYQRQVRPKRVTVTLTQAAIDRLESECEYRQEIEGTHVPPARIVNELIMTHLVDRRNGSNTAGTVKKKKPKK